MKKAVNRTNHLVHNTVLYILYKEEKYITCNSYNTELEAEFITNADGDLLLEFNPDGMLYYN